MDSKRYKDAPPNILLRDYLRLQAEVDYWRYRSSSYNRRTVEALLDRGKQTWGYNKCHSTIYSRARRMMGAIGDSAMSFADLITTVGRFPVSRFPRPLVAMVAIVSDEELYAILSDPLCYCSKSEMVELIGIRFAAEGWRFVERGESADEG